MNTRTIGAVVAAILSGRGDAERTIELLFAMGMYEEDGYALAIATAARDILEEQSAE